MKAYICEGCRKNCSQLYGGNVSGKYTELCIACAFPKKKNEKKIK